MIPSTYDGPRNGDYVVYVDKLLRASPEFRRTQHSIAGAIEAAVSTPGGQASSPMALMRDKLQKAREMAEQAQRTSSLGSGTPTRAAQRAASVRTVSTAGGQPTAKQQAQERFRAIEREIENQKSQASASKAKPWISPFSIVLIIAGMIVSQMVPGFGVVLSVMGVFSLIGGVLNKLKGQ